MAQGLIRRLVTRILRWVWVPIVASIVVVAVAMSCAVWSLQGRMYSVGRIASGGSEAVPVALYQRYGKLWWGAQARGFGKSSFVLFLSIPGENPSSMASSHLELIVVQSGFPFRCLRSTTERRTNLPASSLWIRGIETSRKPGWLGASPRIPLMPEPVGMVLNVLIVSAAIVLPRLAWRRGVVLRRNRKGLCLKCAYPLGDFTVCPECGTPTGRDA